MNLRIPTSSSAAMAKPEQVQFNFRHVILNGMVSLFYAFYYGCAFLVFHEFTCFSILLTSEFAEVLEFDAMPEPPSVLDLEVLDFDGPFGLAVPLGHVEINFLKHTSEELADIWIPLDGKLAQTSQSQLHLRIFLENTKGDETIREYLRKMEKEVGKKVINL